MSNYHESKSLSEVRKWKEQCHQEDKGLSAKEYLERIRNIGESVKLRYNIILQKAIRPVRENLV